METINARTGTNITITHHFKQNAEVYFYQCTGSCRSRPPNFGWIKTQNPRAPNPSSNGHAKKCDGRFVRVYDTLKAMSNVSNDWLHLGANINENSDHNNLYVPLNVNRDPPTDGLTSATVQRSAQDISMNIKQNISFETGSEFNKIDLITDFDAPITDQMFANYHEGQQKLLSVEFLDVKRATSNGRNISIVCQQFVVDEQIYQHLFECSGVSVEQIQYQLPFYRVQTTAE